MEDIGYSPSAKFAVVDDNQSAAVAPWRIRGLCKVCVNSLFSRQIGQSLSEVCWCFVKSRLPGQRLKFPNLWPNC